MDSKEFLERLKNPTRFWIEDTINEFVKDIQYYAWDKFYYTSVRRIGGCHDIKIQLYENEYFNEVDMMLFNYFPKSDSYEIDSPHQPFHDDYYTEYRPLTGLQFRRNVVYTKVYSIVEASCYE